MAPDRRINAPFTWRPGRSCRLSGNGARVVTGRRCRAPCAGRTADAAGAETMD